MAALCVVCIPPSIAHGQRIAGTVVDAASGRPVAAAEVVLLDAVGAALGRKQSDSTGHFAFDLLRAATYALRAERLGYVQVVASRLVLEEGESVVVELRLGVDAIPVDPLVVTARNTVRAGRLREYYERLETNGKSGGGHFITRAEIESRPGAGTADLMRMVPGVNVISRGRAVVMSRVAGGCDPAVSSMAR